MNLGSHGDLDCVREVVNTLQHGRVGADAERHLLRRIPPCPEELLPTVAPCELLPQRRGGPRNGRRRCRPVHGRFVGYAFCGGGSEFFFGVWIGEEGLCGRGFGFQKLRLYRDREMAMNQPSD
jgi:hypothetical protein